MNMQLLSVVTPPYIYHGRSTWDKFWEENFTLDELTPVKMKILVLTMLGNTERSRMVISTSPWTSR